MSIYVELASMISKKDSFNLNLSFTTSGYDKIKKTMDKDMISKLIEEVEKHIENEHYAEAKKLLNDALEKNPENISLLLTRAKLFRQLQNFSEAFNDLQYILKIDPNHEEAKNLLNLTREILQCQQLDIYASTNLNNDPWID